MRVYVNAEQLIHEIQSVSTMTVEYQSPGNLREMELVANVIEQCKECFVGLIRRSGGIDLVRCEECRYSVPLDKHADVWGHDLRHCSMWHGEEVKNVWHKYKKYYKDYSIVEPDGFCSEGERREE